MKITKTRDGNTLRIALEGRLDTATAPELASALEGTLGDITEIRYDLSKLEYVSSAGLRVMLQSHKSMAYGGRSVVTNASEIVREVFEVTGFTELFDFE